MRREKKRGEKLKVVRGSELYDTIFPRPVWAIENQLDLPALIEVKHDGFWITDENGAQVATHDVNCERNSVMISKDSLLWVYKIAFRHLLLTRQMISPKDIDAANLVPHVRVRKDPKDAFSKHQHLHGLKFILTEDMLSAKKDFLIAEIDEDRDLHFTLIFAKGVGKKINLIEIFKNTIRVLNSRPELISLYRKIDNFGIELSQYWYETGDQYPFNLVIPSDWKSNVVQEDFSGFKTTPAGSIIN